MQNNLEKKTASGLLWMFGERIISQLVAFIVSIVLARLLMPNEYGIVALVLVFINIANVFVTSGLGQSLIQDKESDEIDFNTLFITGFVISWFLYFILFFTAPFISQFYDNNILTSVIRIISFKLPIASINSIQIAYISKNMQFKNYFFSTILGTSISGLIGIIIAVMGGGVWALVVQYLLNSVINTIILFITVKWKPKFQYSFERMKKHLSFGIKLMLSSLINNVYLEMQSLCIGKVYTAADLGLFKRGYQFPALIVNNVNSAIGSVMFPAFSKVSDEQDHLKRMMRRSMVLTSYVVIPVMLGMVAVARQLVLLVLTEKWLPCVFFVQTACFSYMLLPIQTANCQAILSKGRSDIYLVMEIIKKVFGIAILIFALYKGVNAIAIGSVVAVIISALISMFPNKSLLGYSIREQVSDLLPSTLMSILMFIPLFLMNNINLPTVLLLVLQIVVGVIVYFGLSIIFKIDSFYYFVQFATTIRLSIQEKRN